MAVRILDRSLSRLPSPLRTLIDWALTITLAAIGVLVFQAEVAKPYRIPSSSMEPTLHCAKPATAASRDSPIESSPTASSIGSTSLNAATSSSSTRHPRSRLPAASTAPSSSGSWACPGESVSMRAGHVFIDGVRLASPTSGLLTGGRRAAVGDAARATGTSSWVTTEPCPGLAPLGRRSPRPHHRPGRGDLLAPAPARASSAVANARGTFPNTGPGLGLYAAACGRRASQGLSARRSDVSSAPRRRRAARGAGRCRVV